MRGQVGQEDQRVADVLGQVPVVQLGLSGDAQEPGCGAVARRVVLLEHVTLLGSDRRLGQDRDPERGGDRQPFVVDCLDQSPDALGHALLVEQEVAAGSLEQRRVEQRDGWMDDRVAVLHGRLEHAVGLLDGRPDVTDEVVEPVRARPRERGEVDPGRELEKHVDDARPGDPHRVRQRVGLAHDDACVVEIQPGRALEGDRAGARPGAHENGHAVAQVRTDCDGQRLGAVRRPHHDDELGARHGLGDIVSGVPDRRESFEIAARGDAAGLVHRDRVDGELRRGIQGDLASVLGEVERRCDPSVACSEHCHSHPDLRAVNWAHPDVPLCTASTIRNVSQCATRSSEAAGVDERSGAERERRVAVRGEEKRVGRHAQTPASDADDEVEQRARVAAGEEDREPGDYDAHHCGQTEEHQHDVVRDRQEPLHQRQPAVELVAGVWIAKVEPHGLVLVGRRIAIVQQRGVDGDARGEARELEVPVKPPARILLPEEDHQQRTGDEHAAGADHDHGRVPSGAASGVDLRGAGHHRENDRDRDDREGPEEGREPVQRPVGIVDIECRRVVGVGREGVHRRSLRSRRRYDKHAPDPIPGPPGTLSAG